MKQWIVGLTVSLVLGGFATWLFLLVLRKYIGSPEKVRLAEGGKSVPAWLTGVVERLFFTILVGLNVAGAPASMVGWLALKLATNWNHPDWKDKPDARSYAFSALLAGLVSMLFALFGGLLCAGKLPL